MINEIQKEFLTTTSQWLDSRILIASQKKQESVNLQKFDEAANWRMIERELQNTLANLRIYFKV